MDSTRYSTYTLKLSVSGAHCNLNCRYCFKDTKQGKAIDLNTAKDAIDFLINKFGPKGSKYVIDLSGSSEPLLRTDFIKAIDRYCQELSEKVQKRIWIQFVSNGALLNGEKIEYLSSGDHNVLFGISLDGPKHIHDDLRINKLGQGTYEQVINNCKSLKNDRLGIAVTLTGKHPNVLEIFLHLYGQEFTDVVSINPVRLPPDHEYSINWGNIETIKENYTELASYLLNKTTQGETDYLWALIKGADYFGGILVNMLVPTRKKYRCAAGFNSFALDDNGDLYLCSVLIGDDTYKIGNIYQGLDQNKLDYFAGIYADNVKTCQNCWAKYICGGECFARSQVVNKPPGEPDEVMCDLKKHLIKLAMYFWTEVRQKNIDIYKNLHADIFHMTVSRFCVDNAYLCLHTMLKKQGVKTPLYKTYQLFALEKERFIRPADLISAAKKVGYELRLEEIRSEQLKDYAPCIAYFDHPFTPQYFVIEDVRKNTIEILDFNNGEIRVEYDKFIKESPQIKIFVPCHGDN